MRARRGDLSGPVLAILVTLILIAIGAAIIAYLTLFTGGTTAPIISVKGQPVAYKTGTNDATVEVVVVNTGNAALNGATASLQIVSPISASPVSAPNVNIPVGTSKTLTFTFTNQWGTFSQYPMVNGILKVTGADGSTVALYEVAIRVVAGS
ncbi:MAG: hypothetical protein P3X22_000065 [Thermoprotei archaeon]|nr:hypothetical protein [Thermoprotei archaeon]